MTDNPYGPDKPCRRTACVDANRAEQRKVLDLMHRDGHPHDALAKQQLAHIRDITTARHTGGAHLDPTDRAHYDGLRIMAAPFRVREACAPLMRHVGAYTKPPGDDTTDSLRAMTEIALDAALREIDQLREQVAHVSVDRDRKVREASARALDCTDHGRIITDLEAQLAAAHAACDRTEKARLALLGEHQVVADLMVALNRPDLERRVTVTEITKFLESANRHAADAHKRAWATR